MKTPSYYIHAIKHRFDVKRSEWKDVALHRHIVVIESDDWGSVRMPSVGVLAKLKQKGYHFFDNIGYDRYDTLASNEDLEILIEALSSVKGADERPAKLTMNCVVANPDFEKIRKSNFQEYHYELLPETLKHYPRHDRSFSLWKEGINAGVLLPQFHGREHLNAQMWLMLLRSGCEPLSDSFVRGVFSTQVNLDIDARQHCLAAYNLANNSEYKFAIQSVREGLDIFEMLFGYRSESMIAPNYTWDVQIEDAAYGSGVKYLQGARVQRHSQYVNEHGGKTEIRHTGQCNGNGQIYMVRNCSFEPSENPKKNADFCLSQIDKCFKRGQVAIISSHRQNYIGDLYPENRDNNIAQLKYLLKTLLKKYPDTVFFSSDELGLVLSQCSVI